MFNVPKVCIFHLVSKFFKVLVVGQMKYFEKSCKCSYFRQMSLTIKVTFFHEKEWRKNPSGIKQSIMFLCKPHLQNRGDSGYPLSIQRLGKQAEAEADAETAELRRQSLLRLWSVLPIMLAMGSSEETHTFLSFAPPKTLFCPSFAQHHSHKMNRGQWT